MAPAKAVKKPRKLLGKKGAAAKKKAGQGSEEAQEMEIPAAGLVGARKGLIYCLVGLISHRRYSSKVLQPCSALRLCLVGSSVSPKQFSLDVFACPTLFFCT